MQSTLHSGATACLPPVFPLFVNVRPDSLTSLNSAASWTQFFKCFRISISPFWRQPSLPNLISAEAHHQLWPHQLILSGRLRIFSFLGNDCCPFSSSGSQSHPSFRPMDLDKTGTSSPSFCRFVFLLHCAQGYYK